MVSEAKKKNPSANQDGILKEFIQKSRYSWANYLRNLSNTNNGSLAAINDLLRHHVHLKVGIYIVIPCFLSMDKHKTTALIPLHSNLVCSPLICGESKYIITLNRVYCIETELVTLFWSLQVMKDEIKLLIT